MSLGADVRYALRGLRLRPLWAAAAAITLALGIGANATMFSLVDRLMLRAPAHVADPGRVVRLGFQFAGRDGETFTMTTTSWPVYQDALRSGASFAALAAIAEGQMVLGAGAEARSLPIQRVTGNYFAMLGARPHLGRLFGPGEDDAPVAVVSYGFWRRQLDGDAPALGRRLSLDGRAFDVIGVVPPDFTGDETEPVDAWIPLGAAMALSGSAWRETRGMRLVRVTGRLREGAAAAAAAGEVSAALTPLVPGLRRFASLPAQGKVALWVAGMSIVVLLIAVVNVANLMLFRATARRREFAVRLALGGSRWQLGRQLIIESLVLALIGGAGAVFAAAWGAEAVRRVLMPGMAGMDQLVSLRLVIITAAATVAAGLLASLVPALRSSRPDPDVLRSGGAAGRVRSWTPSALLATQGALCTVLLIGAALFLVSLHRVRTQDFGFVSDGLLLATMRFPESAPGERTDALYRQGVQSVRGVPGVLSATIVQVAPFSGHNVPPISVPGRPDFPDLDQQAPFLAAATPEYFTVLGMRLLEGRAFTRADGAGSPLAVIVNQAMAEGLWPGESALGRCIRVGFLEGVPPSGIVASPLLPCRTVVGVVNNARPRSIREESGQARMHYYVPFGQLPKPPFPGTHPEIWGLLVRTTDADAMVVPVRRALQSFAPDLPYAEVRPLMDVLERQMRPWMLGATMFTVFGLLALGLAVVGLYAVRAYSVAQRTREIGVRIALGARAGEVIRLVLLESARVTAAGLLIGIALTLALGGRIEPLLFQTSASDGRVFALVAAILALIAVLGSVIPAMRAARVDPSVALRSE